MQGLSPISVALTLRKRTQLTLFDCTLPGAEHLQRGGGSLSSHGSSSSAGQDQDSFLEKFKNLLFCSTRSSLPLSMK